MSSNVFVAEKNDRMLILSQLTLLRALVLFAMSSSKAVRDIIDQAYKGKRQEDDSNIKLSVQPWGSDSDKRRYFLVEGLDDTSFRVFRESNPAGFNRTWWNMAGSIDELKFLTGRLETHDRGPKAKKLAVKLTDEIPRFEATEEVGIVCPKAVRPRYANVLTRSASAESTARCARMPSSDRSLASPFMKAALVASV